MPKYEVPYSNIELKKCDCMSHNTLFENSFKKEYFSDSIFSKYSTVSKF